MHHHAVFHRACGISAVSRECHDRPVRKLDKLHFIEARVVQVISCVVDSGFCIAVLAEDDITLVSVVRGCDQHAACVVCTWAELNSDTAGRRDTTPIVQIGQAVRDVLDRRESKATVCRNSLVKHARFTREISLLESRRGVAEHDDEPVCHRVVRLRHLLPAHAWSRDAHRQNHRTKADATI